MAVIKVEKEEFAVKDAVELNVDESKTNLRFERDGDAVVMHLAMRLKNEKNIFFGEDEVEVEAESLGVFKFGEDNSFLEGGLNTLTIDFEPTQGAGPNINRRVRLQTANREFDMKTTGEEKRESGAPSPPAAQGDKNQYSPA